MAALLKEFDTTQILIFIVMAAAAIKGVISFFDWAKERMTQQVHTNELPINLNKKIDLLTEHYQKEINSLRNENCQMQNRLNDLIGKIDILLESDKDDIKAWITEQYYRFTKQGSIDSYSLDCIEKRYDHYKQENGNSFVKTLVDEIRTLPKK